MCCILNDTIALLVKWNNAWVTDKWHTTTTSWHYCICLLLIQDVAIQYVLCVEKKFLQKYVTSYDQKGVKFHDIVNTYFHGSK